MFQFIAIRKSIGIDKLNSARKTYIAQAYTSPEGIAPYGLHTFTARKHVQLAAVAESGITDIGQVLAAGDAQ